MGLVVKKTVSKVKPSRRRRDALLAGTEAPFIHELYHGSFSLYTHPSIRIRHRLS